MQETASAAPHRTNFPEVPEGRPLGIITIEDVIEELIQQVCFHGSCWSDPSILTSPAEFLWGCIAVQ